MKKAITKNRLSLSTTTVRALDTTALVRVEGAGLVASLNKYSCNVLCGTACCLPGLP